MILWIRRFWRLISVLLVAFSAWVAFLHTPMISADVPWRYFEALYHAITLFFVGGTDLGYPRADSFTVRVVLWLDYFIAPLLTLSFAYRFIQENILSRLSPTLTGHTIICGLGRNGKLIYDLVKAHSAKNHKIVIIEKNPHNAYSAMLEKDPATWWLKNDFTELPILQKAQLARAQRVYITTNHDLANLNALVAIQEVHQNSKNFNLYCHLGDLNLHTNLGKTLLHDPRFATVKLFNGYHVVTHRLYKNWLVNKGYLNPEGNIFIILGFGRFGQMLYSHLVADTERPGQDEMMIATLKLSFMLDLTHYDWAEVRKRDRCKIHEPFYQDIRSPGLWDKLAQQIRTAGTKSVIIFACVDDDIMNINVAIAMKLNGPEELQRATIICRTFSPMAHEINDILEKRLTSRQARDVILFPLQQELQAAFQEELFSKPEPL